MEDTELEEGEACSYQNNYGDYHAIIDPDVALSYIDEKLHDVLGHFQKDFEGEVSAKNLGAKFGLYGSFLPTYQRSPVCSHPKTPQKFQQQNARRSPNNLQLEGVYYNPMTSSVASHSGRPGSASNSVMLLPSLKAPSFSDSEKQEAQARSFEEIVQYGLGSNKPASLPDQKTFKVRIKMGSDNLSTLNNAEIYSGLGLDLSPSSSLDESHSESEGLSHEPQEFPRISPTSILQIMTSFPVIGAFLLSPLPDYVLHLGENEKETRSLPAPKDGLENFGLLANGPDSFKGDAKVLGEKKKKLGVKNDFLAWRNGYKDAQDDMYVGKVKKDAVSSEELVSSTLKLPLLSSSNSPMGEMARGMAKESDMSTEADKVEGEKIVSCISKEEPLDPISSQDAEKEKAYSHGKSWDDKNPRRDAHYKGDLSPLIYNSVNTDSDVTRGNYQLNDEFRNHSVKKVNQKASSHKQEDLRLPLGKENPSSGGKRKSKGSPSYVPLAAKGLKKSFTSGSPLVPKSKKSTRADSYVSKSDQKEIKLEKDIGMTSDAYKDIFGDINIEEGENLMGFLPFEDRPNNVEVVDKSTSAIKSVSGEKSSGKKTNKPPAVEAYPKAGPNVPPRFANRPNSDAFPAPVAPIVIEEHWVCCDKCQKWRLLPLGVNTDDLPENWLCSMLDWLPGKNRCSISEEETTKDLIALYQVPPSESQNFMQSNTIGTVSALTLADVQQHNANDLNSSLHVPTGGKRKYGVKEISNPMKKDGPTHFSNSLEKNAQILVKSRSLNDVNHYPIVTDLDMEQLSKSSDCDVKKYPHKLKEEQSFLDHNPDEGGSKNSKMKSKRYLDQDYFDASKKMKTEGTQCTDEDWTSDYGRSTRKMGTSSSCGFPTTLPGKDQAMYNDLSFSKEKYDSKYKLQVSSEKPKVKTPLSSAAGSLIIGDCDERDIKVKKRIVKEYQDTQKYLDSRPSSGHRLQDSRILVKEEISENDYRKEKKARVSKSTGKEASASKGNSGKERKGSRTKYDQLGQDTRSTLSQRSLDCINTVKRDVGSVQPSVAATSSSSKVSGSHKTKIRLQEVKSSPVGSVSSSPIRILKSDKFTSVKRNLAGNYDSQDTSPRRCSDGEDDGGSDRSRTERRVKNSNVAHQGSLDSTVQDRNLHNLPAGKVNSITVPSADVMNHHFLRAATGNLGHDPQYNSKLQSFDGCLPEERQNAISYSVNGSRPRKPGKQSSSRSKERNWSNKSEADMVNIKNRGSLKELPDCASTGEVNFRHGKSKSEDFGEMDNKYVPKRESSGKFSTEGSKREGHCGAEVKAETRCSQDTMSTKHSTLQGCDSEKPSRKVLSDKTDKVDVASGRGKALPLPSPGGVQSETQSRYPRPISGNLKGNGVDAVAVDSSEANDIQKVPKVIRKAENQNRVQHTSYRNPTHKIRNLDARSPVRKDPSSQAANNSVKEAKDLKHLADRLKNSGSNHESTGLYFQAALKFLHGASQLESCNSENGKHGEMIQSVQLYSDTAKLCEFCAHEYEKSKDMANASLAYKCMEVAYMRVVYCSTTSASRDRHELQTSLQIVPPGESPSSSASDVDNLNNPTPIDKASLPKGINSPRVTGNHVITARNRPNFVRLLKFAQDANFAMEASRKSQIAFAAANMSSVNTQYREDIFSIKRALDFNFQDIEGLLPLVRLAMEAIGH